ncbi:hypothetical protein AZE42_06972 [Rhizopogon vesiculosus]|uniref:F-box domain-containing protein n=1 Tax=Rhizopogon vesiculosus TaxID=180088 RepID=A0A1J8Q7R3_9AGAM|nr:hypothetical protein AZE42_06972 [Rhizopogon vesiculosus]
MRDLPIELICAVVQNVSATADLLHLRSVNWTYRELVTPRIFSKLHIKNSIQSAQNCHQIIGVASLAAHVREVIYDSRDNEHLQLLPHNTGNDALEVSELEEALTETFCGITPLPRLERVMLNFWPSFLSQSGREVPESPFWFTNRQLAVLHAVHHGMKTSRMNTLTLNNVILPTTCHDFVASLTESPLSHLSISVVSNAEVSTWSGSKNVNGSLGALLPPSNSTLKSLVLRSPQGPYHSLTTRLSSLHYPSLESLVLENIVFDQTPSADGVEDFILRHKDTLQRLELRSCACHIPGSSTDVRRWSFIWQRWASELTGLRELVVNNDSHGYVLFDADRGYIPHGVVSPIVVEDDSSSLQAFKDTIAVGQVVV